MHSATQSTLIGAAAAALLVGCATGGPRYQDKTMDFGSIRTVAVMPLTNFSREVNGGDRVRDVVENILLASGGFYVLPTGEVSRAVQRLGIPNAAAPSKDEVIAIGKALSSEAILVGALKEYGEVRSGNSTANVISLSLQLQETQTGRVVWSGSTSKGGIGVWDRLFGGGGEPMNKVTEEAVRDLVHQLFN
jgi:hypothetical protein